MCIFLVHGYCFLIIQMIVQNSWKLICLHHRFGYNVGNNFVILHYKRTANTSLLMRRTFYFRVRGTVVRQINGSHWQTTFYIYMSIFIYMLAGQKWCKFLKLLNIFFFLILINIQSKKFRIVSKLWKSVLIRDRGSENHTSYK